MPPVPPPLWQERPTSKVVVTQEDLKSFQHFWAVNEDKKLLMVAIPKASLERRGLEQYHSIVV